MKEWLAIILIISGMFYAMVTSLNDELAVMEQQEQEYILKHQWR